MAAVAQSTDAGMAWALARSRRRFAEGAAAAEAWREAREARGLVSVSTTCKDVPVAVFMAENSITIDQQQARVTRLRKAVGISAKCLHNQGTRTQSCWMLTLTYAGDNSAWRPEHISRYLDSLRRWHYAKTGSKAVRYVWVAELQQRGVIHYHVIVWLDGALTPPMPDKPWRNRDGMQSPMWPHGMSNRLRSTAPVAYLMKYASKIETKNVSTFPRGARIHGAGGLNPDARGIRRWVLWPAYVQGNAAVGEPWKPAKGGGFTNASTGEHLASEWAPTGAGFSTFLRVGRTPRRLQDPAGPFCWMPSEAIH